MLRASESENDLIEAIFEVNVHLRTNFSRNSALLSVKGGKKWVSVIFSARKWKFLDVSPEVSLLEPIGVNHFLSRHELGTKDDGDSKTVRKNVMTPSSR